MNFSADQFLSNSLTKRQEQNALRKLVNNDSLIDFCSNDYLGFASSEELKNAISQEYSMLPKLLNGSTGSRLLAGNSEYAETLEAKIALFHNAEAGLIYNSGYDANVGLFSALGQKGDTIIYDALIHASVHDGMKLSSASTYQFKHNDLVHLEERLKIAEGIIYVAAESVYSMDGDYAPLKEIAALCKKYNANFVVDEAHATGITANLGKGRVQELGLEKEVFARVHTFGKALGCHGAIVLGSNLLRDFLINYSRAFIYTTALPIKSLVAINQSYQLLEKSAEVINDLNRLIESFKNNLVNNPKIQLIESFSPIQCIVVGGNNEVKELAFAIQKEGFDVRAILNPTVLKGKERLRICIHAFNTQKQVENLTKAIINSI
jgi:8-amino-7-oxononanoate synthase